VSPDERWIASGDRDGVVIIWDAATGHRQRGLEAGRGEVTAVRFSPDGKWLSTAGQDRTVHLWKTDSWREEQQIQKHTMTICALAWSPDSKWLASGGRDGDVHIWDVTNARHHHTLSGHVDAVRCIAWSPHGTRLATANGNLGVYLWDTDPWERRALFESAGTRTLAMAFSDDSRWLAFGGYSGVLTLANNDTGATVIHHEAADQIWSLAFLPDDRILAGLGAGKVEVVRWNQGVPQLEFEWLTCFEGGGTHRAVLSMAADSRFVVATEEDRSIKLVSR